MSVFDYKRRHTHQVNIGNTPLGADYPIRVQSMTSTSTMDTDASVRQAKAIIDAGGEYVRLTAQGVREAANLGEIRAELHKAGYTAPLVADIHFNPKAAFEAAKNVEKVRINPGNFVDPGRTFKKLTYTDDEYRLELQRIDDALTPLIELCRGHGTAIRIGVNHGSLSDRIMSRYGDTPAGMVESAMEFLRVFVKRDFHDVVISIKASNTVVMTETVRRLVKAMADEEMDFPLHLGVTEAGAGEDGRVKSALGIGALLHQGIGDTIRVSLSESPEAEIPVARRLIERLEQFKQADKIDGKYYNGFNSITPQRRQSRAIGNIGGNNIPVAVGVDNINSDNIIRLSADNAHTDIISDARKNPDKIILLTSDSLNPAGAIQGAIHAMVDADIDNPVIPCIRYDNLTNEQLTIDASADFGSILLNGFCDGIAIEAPGHDIVPLSLAILQAARLRFSHTDYISCPGCGRTMFDLQTTVIQIKQATSHLTGLKIGVMGCIVNGPGEMADADYGYVGAAAGRVSLYRGRDCVERNIPAEFAIDKLINLLKQDGKWTDPG